FSRVSGAPASARALADGGKHGVPAPGVAGGVLHLHRAGQYVLSRRAPDLAAGRFRGLPKAVGVLSRRALRPARGRLRPSRAVGADPAARRAQRALALHRGRHPDPARTELLVPVPVSVLTRGALFAFVAAIG